MDLKQTDTQQKYNPNLPLLFMHIPKCAGTSVDDALSEALRPKSVFHLLGPTLYGDYDDFDSFSPDVRGWVHETATAVPPLADYVSGHAGSQWLSAHFPVGQKITFLREPKMRVLSHWLFWRTFSSEQISLWGSYSARMTTSQSSLATFLSYPGLASQIDNVFVRMLLYPHPLIPGGDFIDPAHDEILLNEALSEIERFAYVGVVGDRDFIRKLSDWLGTSLNMKRQNETQTMPLHLRYPIGQDLDDASLDLLDQRTRLDARIWEKMVFDRLQQPVDTFRDRQIIKSVANFAQITMPEGYNDATSA